MFGEVEIMLKEVLGEKHEDTQYSKFWLAMCLYNKQQFDNAELMFREVVKMRKEVLGRTLPKISFMYLVFISLYFFMVLFTAFLNRWYGVLNTCIFKVLIHSFYCLFFVLKTYFVCKIIGN